MSNTIFFSWQVDTQPLTGRNFIERALERAIHALKKDVAIEPAIRDFKVDRDTKDVGGQVPIVETIFRKIDKAAVFVPDLTFVGYRLDGRPTPNPNVLIEYGWALKALTHSRIVPVMNVAFGEPTADTMPFDMAHLRHPLTYNCPDDLDETGRRAVREQLTRDFEKQLRLVFESQEFRQSLPKPPPFVNKEPIDGRGRLKRPEEAIGVFDDFPNGMSELTLSSDPVCWFRLMPSVETGQAWSIALLEAAIKAKVLIPLGGAPSLGFFRCEDGFGTYTKVGADHDTARSAMLVFANGEMWTADAYSLQACVRDDQKYVPNLEKSFRGVLAAYGEFLSRLGIAPPFKWLAGMENLKGRNLYKPTSNGLLIWPGPQGKCLVDVVAVTGSYTPGDSPGTALKPFFAKLYDSCGATREDWQDD